MAITTLNATDSGATSRTTINDNFTDLDTTKADLASPTFTGTVTSPALKITTGAGANKILTSDADGDATWEVNSSSLNVELSTNATTSLTADGVQTILVVAFVQFKGSGSGSSDSTVALKYGATEKATSAEKNAATTEYQHVTLAFTEVLAAGTQNLTVTATYGSVIGVRYLIMKIG